MTEANPWMVASVATVIIYLAYIFLVLGVQLR